MNAQSKQGHQTTQQIHSVSLFLLMFLVVKIVVGQTPICAIKPMLKNAKVEPVSPAKCSPNVSQLAPLPTSNTAPPAAFTTVLTSGSNTSTALLATTPVGVDKLDCGHTATLLHNHVVI